MSFNINLPLYETSTVLRSFTFVKSGQYVNFARIPPALLAAVSYHAPNSAKNMDSASSSKQSPDARKTIRWAHDQGQVAVGIMPVVVDSCEVINPAWVGKNPAYRIRRISALPFPLSWRRDQSLWGTLLNFDDIPGTVSPSGIAFQTQGEGKGILYYFLATSFPSLIIFDQDGLLIARQ